MEQAQRDLRNYIRRVKAAIAKLYGPGAELRVMGLTGCGRKSGRYHHHLLVECKGLTMRQNADFRQLLEDKWAVRWPDGSVESLGTANADRLNLQNRLDDLITYFEKHGQMRWYETKNLTLPVERAPTTPDGASSSCARPAPSARTTPTGGNRDTRAGSLCGASCRSRTRRATKKRDGTQTSCAAVVMVKREGAKVRT